MTPTCSTCRYFVVEPYDVECEFFNKNKDHDWEEGEDGLVGCKECAVAKDPIEQSEIDLDNAMTGTCHRGAPQPVMYCFLPSGPPQEVVHDETGPHYIGEPEGPDTTTIWPAVDAEDYCGEYKMIDRKKK